MTTACQHNRGCRVSSRGVGSGWPLVMAAVMLAGWGGCRSTAEGPDLFGTATSAESLVADAQPLSALLEAAARSGAGQDAVTVSGTIGKVCQSMGCWFYLTDEDSMILIDLEQGSRFTIPTDATGRPAVVRGRLAVEGGDQRLVASAAAIYPVP